MEYLIRSIVKRLMVLLILVSVFVCTFNCLGLATDERESESSPDIQPQPPGASDSAVFTDDNTQEQPSGIPDVKTEKTLEASSFETYKKLFNQNRATQLSGVKSLLKFGNDKQRYSLVHVLLKQLFKTLEDAKQNLTISGYTPNDPFPTDEAARNAFSKVLENTALFGDIALRLPDAVHSVYDKEKEWQALMLWCYNFCLDSGVYEGTSSKLLNLMAQEIKIIPKEPNFINPFKVADSLELERLKPPKKIEKKPKKKIARGPRLRHTEL